MRKILAVALLTGVASAGVLKVASQPVRHPKKDAKAVAHGFKKAGHKVGHLAKKVVL